MKRASWMTLCFSMALGMPTRLIASDNLVELVLLFDVAQLQDGVDRWRAAEFGRDLIDNLPSRVGVQVLRFGHGPGLVLLPFNKLTTPDGLAGATTGATGIMVQQALLETEKFLCRQEQEKNSPDKIIVLVGGSTGNERLELSGVCPITVYSVSARSESDPALREFAERTHGMHYSLARTKGYTVWKAIRERHWTPAVFRSLRTESSEPERAFSLRFYIYILLFVAVLVASLMAYLRKTRSGRSYRSTRGLAEHAILQTEVSGPEAGLTICSETGTGEGVFWFNLRGPLILGGKQHTGSPPADLVLDDPLVAGEHCKIYLEAGRFFAEDMESREGTFVNGEKLREPKSLYPGDELKVGRARFMFVIGQV